MFTRQILEKYQAGILLLAIIAGLIIGAVQPVFAANLDQLIWTFVGVLLYASFTQVPLRDLRTAFLDQRFLTAAVVGNFVILPCIVWVLLSLLPDDPAIRIGVILVLLVPCTDWFITFTQLGRGDTRRAIAFVPLSLLLQLVLLPVYLWLFLDMAIVTEFIRAELLWAFGGLIVLPLSAAYVTQHWAAANKNQTKVLDSLAWIPVPLLACVVLLIAASQFHIIADSSALLGQVFVVFALFMALAVSLARVLTSILALPNDQGRTLAFSFGTRNSFVVLPVALALPASFEAAIVVIVFQSLIELFGMVLLLWLVPDRLFKAKAEV